MASENTKTLHLIIKKLDKIDSRLDTIEYAVTKNGERIDKLGVHLAEVDDDAPSSEEFQELDNRVTKLESDFAAM